MKEMASLISQRLRGALELIRLTLTMDAHRAAILLLGIRSKASTPYRQMMQSSRCR
jgi:hypothetical protein